MADTIEAEERLTEVGAPEVVDRATHPVGGALGALALVVVVVFGVVGLGHLVGGSDEGPEVPEVVVPRLASRAMVQAQAELERLGLLVDVRFEPNELVPPDVVVDQQPIAGARVEVGEQVVLVVSDGPVGVTVPDLRGGEGTEVSRVLDVLGLELSIDRRFDEVVPTGRVIRSEPPGGTRAVAGSAVVVIVSLGPAPRTVPAVVGTPIVEGFAAIGRADLEIDRVRERTVDADEVGRVLATDPPAGAQVPRDLPIEVTVGVARPLVQVPDLVGMTSAAAAEVAAGAGVDVRTRTEAVPAGDPRAGRVIRQDPLAGTWLTPGASVTVTVGLAPAPPPTVPPPTVPPSTAPRRTSKRMVPWSVNLAALLSRLKRIWRTFVRSARMTPRSGGQSTSNVLPFLATRGWMV